MDKIVMTTGAAILNSLISISITDCIMKTPTITRAGAVAAVGIARIKGEKNKAPKNNKAVVIAVRPVLPKD